MKGASTLQYSNYAKLFGKKKLQKFSEFNIVLFKSLLSIRLSQNWWIEIFTIFNNDIRQIKQYILINRVLLITYVKNEMTLRRNYEMIYSKLQHLPTPGDPLGIWKLVRSNSRPLNQNCVKIPHPSAEFDGQLFCKRQEQQPWLSIHLPATDLTIQALKFRPCRRLLLSHQLAKGNSFSLNTSM